MNTSLFQAAAAVSLTILTGCGGGGDSAPAPAAAPVPAPFDGGLPRYVSQIAVPGVDAATNYSFDLGVVVGTKYYFTDRNNAGVQAIDIATLASAGKIQGAGATAFTGLGADNSVSGPDGINAVGPLLYVGDVNSVKVVDPMTNVVLKSIAVGAAGVRADEGCVDEAHHLYMISSPEAPVPFAAFISTFNQGWFVVAVVTFNDNKGIPAKGLEQCRYDSVTDSFFVNNDGTTDNPHGELVRLPGAAVRDLIGPLLTEGEYPLVNYTALAGASKYPLGNCDPTGLALGPGTDIAVGCRETTTGAPLLVQILNRNTGAIVASLNAGGGDQLEYDSRSDRYYSPSSRWTASGTAAANGSCSAASPCTPVLTTIDATQRTVISRLATGNNAHSVAVDPITGSIFMPFSSSSAPAGCATCASNGFTNGGVAVFKTN